MNSPTALRKASGHTTISNLVTPPRGVKSVKYLLATPGGWQMLAYRSLAQPPDYQNLWLERRVYSILRRSLTLARGSLEKISIWSELSHSSSRSRRLLSPRSTTAGKMHVLPMSPIGLIPLMLCGASFAWPY